MVDFFWAYAVLFLFIYTASRSALFVHVLLRGLNFSLSSLPFVIYYLSPVIFPYFPFPIPYSLLFRPDIAGRVRPGIHSCLPAVFLIRGNKTTCFQITINSNLT